MAKERYHSAYIYLNEDYYKKPKFMYMHVAEKIKSSLKGKKSDSPVSILDIGCSRGEFLYYIKNNIKFDSMAGVDFSQVLIKKARGFKGLAGVEFFCDLAESFKLKEKFDVITMIGVLSYFDNVEALLKNLKRHLKKDGSAFITGIFNKYDIDVITRYRNNKYSSKFQPGWNNISLTTFSKQLNNIGLKVRNTSKFILPFDCRRAKDPSRSWTALTDEGKKYVNGLGMIYDIYTVKIGF